MTEDDYAKKILDYMKLNMNPKKVDVIIGLGSLDSRTAERSAELMLEGYADLLVFTGGFGKVTKAINSLSEAETFAEIAIKRGVSSDNILLEKSATNTGDNIKLSQKLLASKGIQPKSVMLVTKPYMERRALATFKRQWTDESTELVVASPNLTYEEHFDNIVPKELFLSVMVGDVQRIREFPKLGFQIEQEIPDDVWEAFEQLTAMGYDSHVLKG